MTFNIVLYIHFYFHKYMYSNPSKYTTLELYEFEVYEWTFCYQKLDLFECHSKCTRFWNIFTGFHATSWMKSKEKSLDFLKKRLMKALFEDNSNHNQLTCASNSSFAFFFEKILLLIKWITVILCSEKFQDWPLYYLYSISMHTNSKCTTFLAARKLVYFEGLL